MVALPDLSAAQIRNLKIAIPLAPTLAVAERVAMAGWTETNWRNLANDGKAFRSDAEVVRPGWVDGVGQALRSDLYAILRLSLNYPNDGIGNNGGSTGIYQQLSQDYVGRRFPGAKWGWGTLAQTMDVKEATKLYLAKVIVTSELVYKDDYGNTVKLSDPIARDVLTVQRPTASEGKSANYGTDNIAIAKWLARKFWVKTSSTSQSGELARTDRPFVDRLLHWS